MSVVADEIEEYVYYKMSGVNSLTRELMKQSAMREVGIRSGKSFPEMPSMRGAA